MNHPYFFIHVLVRWLEFVALVGLVGGLVYWNFVASAISRELSDDGARSFRRWILTAVLILGAAAGVDMIFRSLMISGRPIERILEFLPAVLLKTHFGKVWMGQSLLIVILAGFFLLKRPPNAWTHGERLISLGTSIGICLTVSLSGHAADLGDLRLTVLSDLIHVVAISSWVGGLFALRWQLSGALASLEEGARSRCLRVGIERFTKVAVSSVVALMAGGIYNTYVHVHSSELLASTSYGKILIVKWVLVLPMLVLGALSRYGILPLLQEAEGKMRKGFLARWVTGFIKARVGTPGPKKLEQWFFRLITIEALLGLGVLACSAWMTQLAPPHQTPSVFNHDGHTM